MERTALRRRLEEAARAFPPEVQPEKLRDISRALYQLELVRDPAAAGDALLDIGGGFSMFPIACAIAGYQTTVADTFAYHTDHPVADAGKRLFDTLGIRHVAMDLEKDPFPFSDGAYAAVTCIAVIEHFHHSPRAMLMDAMRVLRPGGRFLLATPNCVNLRKRMTVPFGRGKWSALESWYGEPKFLGHVREPDLADLRYIARDMGLASLQSHGANWVGHTSPSGLIRTATKLMDVPLRVFPALCGDIYVAGQKGEA